MKSSSRNNTVPVRFLAALCAGTSLMTSLLIVILCSMLASAQPRLESLGVPSMNKGIPSTNMWRAGNILYGEAVDPVVDRGPFIAYDLTQRAIVYSGDSAIHTGYRNIMVDRRGNAYFSVNTNGLARYSPATNSVEVLNLTLPGFLRASTRQASDGWIYGATHQAAVLFRYHPERDLFETMGSAWGYTTHMVLDPAERFFYYIPGAHGSAWQMGTPLLQVDVKTGEHKVIAFLNSAIEARYGLRLGGTYALDIDASGRTIYINMNGETVGVDRNGFGTPAVVVVHIPESETGGPPTPAARFEDVSQRLGIKQLLDGAYIHTASWGDADGDGRPDLFVGTFADKPVATVPNKLLLNRGNRFIDAGQAAVEIRNRASGSVFADLDNDGDLDLVISNNRKAAGTGATVEPSRILRNDNGTFVDVTAGSGLDAQATNGRQVAVLDYDGDGLLDLFIAGDALVGRGPTVLLRNNGNFTFEHATARSGLPTAMQALGCAVADVNLDGWPDLFVAGGGRHDRNYLFLSNGDGTFRSFNSMVFDWTPFVVGGEDWVSSAAFGDVNRDGLPDVVIGHHFGTAAERGIGAKIRLYLHRGMRDGEPVFEDVTDAAGLPAILSKAPHVEIQDFDNDGWPDIYVSIRIDTPDGPMPLIFRNNGAASGDPTFSAPVITNPYYFPGGPACDFDGDGRLDVFFEEWRTALGQGNLPPMLMKNNGPAGNWLQVEVHDRRTAMGVGAKVKVYRQGLSDQPEGLLGFAEISPSYGYSSSQTATAHFGLGTEAWVDVVAEMPFSGPVYCRANVPANRVLVLPDGAVEPDVHQGLQASAIRVDSDRFIADTIAGLPPHTTAATAPVVDFAPHPRPSYSGNPWSQWGGGTVASDGRFYSAIGDHIGLNGNAYVFVYDPITRKITCIGDALTAVNHVTGSWGHGKIHAQINESDDGHLYTTTYWGTRSNLRFDENYKGSVILRYPVTNRFVSGSGTTSIGRPSHAYGGGSFDVSIAPHPVQGRAIITVKRDQPTSPISIEVHDLLGRKIFSLPVSNQRLGTSVHSLNLSGNPAGVYLMKVWEGTSISLHRFLVMQ